MEVKQDCTKKSGWEAVKCIWNEYSYLWIVPAFIIGLIIGVILPLDGTFFENFKSELLSIGLTVTVLYALDQWRQGKAEEKRLKEELLWQVKSRSNETAKTAIDRLQAKGWLTSEHGLLKGIDLTNANLYEADLAYANLEETILESANLEGANLKGTNLYRANLSYTNLKRADFLSAYLVETDLSYADLEGGHLNHTNLEDANLEGTNLEKAWFYNANLSRTRFNKTNLKLAHLAYANLEDVSLFGVNLEKANLSYAIFNDVFLFLVNLKDANLLHAKLENTIFYDKSIKNRKHWSITLPDGTQWTDNTDMTRFTDPNHPDFWQPNNETEAKTTSD